VPAKSVAELFVLAKAQPGKLSFASLGVGTPQHIAGELLNSLAGVDIAHVPYRGAILTDVISGRVTMTLQNMGAILPLVRDGKLRGLAVTSMGADHSQPTHAGHSAEALKVTSHAVADLPSLEGESPLNITKRGYRSPAWTVGDQLPGWAYRTRTGESVRALTDWNSVTTSPEVGASRAAETLRVPAA
jgi:hypothetical protein